MPTTTSADGTSIAYDVTGSGPPLVYVTGATTFRRFQPVLADVKAFAREFTVVSYDRRGRGDSGPGGAWSLDRELEDLAAVVDAVGGRAAVYGHSSGAVLGMHAAHRFPEKVSGAVLYDASWVHDQTERAEYAELADRVGALLEDGRNAAALRTFLRGIGMPGLFVAALPLFPGWRTMVALAPTLRYDIELTRETPPLDLAAQVAVPTSVVVGGRSPRALHAVARALAGAIEGSTLTVVSGQDHMVSAKAMLPVLRESLRPGAADGPPSAQM